MKKPIVFLAVLVVCLAALSGFDSTFSFGKDTPPVEATASTEAMGSDVLAFQNLVSTVEIAHTKFSSLAAAMPEATYAWQPMDGVRTVSAVYIHIAADNFFVPSLMGLDAPDETGITDDVMTFRAYQEREMTKAEVVAAVDHSFEVLLGAREETANNLERPLMLGGGETTVGDIWIRAVTHLHEHLGQSIAYARTKEVVPPWSN